MKCETTGRATGLLGTTWAKPFFCIGGGGIKLGSHIPRGVRSGVRLKRENGRGQTEALKHHFARTARRATTRRRRSRRQRQVARL